MVEQSLCHCYRQSNLVFNRFLLQIIIYQCFLATTKKDVFNLSMNSPAVRESSFNSLDFSISQKVCP